MTLAAARVVATFGRQSLVMTTDHRLLPAVRRGKRGDVVVGDRVQLGAVTDSSAVIEAIEPRRSLLFRADALRTKAMAANVDQVAVIYAPQPAYSETFVWRALLAASTAGLDSVVVLNKADVTTNAESAERTRDALAQLGHRTLRVSVKHDANSAREGLTDALRGRATLLVGQSGMGKSSVLNLLLPDAAARTQEFSSKLNLGKQTTTASRWFDLPATLGGGALIDSPGFQSFGLAHLEPGAAADALPDFAPHLNACRFSNCRHLEEPGCAIRAAVERSEITAARYAFYRELCAEAR